MSCEEQAKHLVNLPSLVWLIPKVAIVDRTTDYFNKKERDAQS